MQQADGKISNKMNTTDGHRLDSGERRPNSSLEETVSISAHSPLALVRVLDIKPEDKMQLSGSQQSPG